MALPLIQSGGGGSSSSAVTSVFTRTGAVVAASGDYTWNQIGSSAGALTLSNGANTTTFNQTANTTWAWSNTTTGSAVTTNASPILQLTSQYWTGAASATDSWTLGSALAAGTNGASTLSLLHSGSTGRAVFSVPDLLVKGDNLAGNILEVHGGGATPFVAAFFNDTYSPTVAGVQYYVDNTGNFFLTTGATNKVLNFGTSAFNSNALVISGDNVTVTNVFRITGGNCQFSNDANVSRLGAASLAIGNSAAGDFSGSLKLTTLTVQGKVATYNGIATVSNGVPSEIATVDSTGLVAAVTTTTLYTPTATGMFRISAYLKITTAGTSPVLGPLTIAFTDGTDSVAQSQVMQLATQAGASATSNAGNTTTSTLNGEMIVWAKTGVAITYAIALTGTVGTGVYEVHLKCEAM